MRRWSKGRKCPRPLDEIFPMTRAKADSAARSGMKWNSTSSLLDGSAKAITVTITMEPGGCPRFRVSFFCACKDGRRRPSSRETTAIQPSRPWDVSDNGRYYLLKFPTSE